MRPFHHLFSSLAPWAFCLPLSIGAGLVISALLPPSALLIATTLGGAIVIQGGAEWYRNRHQRAQDFAFFRALRALGAEIDDSLRRHDVRQATLSAVSTLRSRALRAVAIAQQAGEGNRRFEAMLRTLPLGVFAVGVDRSIIFFNQKASVLLSEKGIEAKANIQDAIDDEALREYVLRCTGAQAPRRVSKPLLYAPSRYADRRYTVHAQQLDDGQGHLLATLFSLQDATALHESRKVRDEFVGHLAHELKTPIQVISMFAETLQNDEDDDRAARIDSANIIRDEAERIDILVNNLLNVTRLESGGITLHRSRTLLKELLENAFHEARRKADIKGLTMALEIPPDLAAVHIDKTLFAVAINNLLSNAVKYSDAGGNIHFGVDSDSGTIRIWVRDTGIGIPKEEQERIFDKFFRASNADLSNESGHGVGLSLARHIVHLHGGNLLLESAPGQGSVFTIELSRNAELQQEAA